MKKNLFIILFLFICSFNYAQVIQWSTYLNSTGNDLLSGTTKNANGDIFVLGLTDANGFPVTPGAFQSTLGVNTQKLTVSKLSGATGSLLWSTYLGGDNDVIKPSKIYWDPGSNTINISGSTKSNNFPIVNGNPKNPQAIYAPFLTQFNANTGAAIFSTYVFEELALNQGGSQLEYRSEFENGFAYYLSQSVTLHSVLISKINLATHQLVYQKAITGSNGVINSIIGVSSLGLVIDNDDVFISGGTTATDFPTTPGSYQPVFPVGEAEAYFITKLNSSGDIVFSTYANPHPGSYLLLYTQLAVGNNEVAIAEVYNPGIAVSPGGIPFDNREPLNLGLLKLNKNDGSLRFFSYLGGNSIQDAFPLRSIMYSGDDLIMCGNSAGTYLPITPNAIQPYNSYHIPNGYYAGDCFIIHMNASNQVVYCSFLGGNESEVIYNIKENNNSIILNGITNSNNFPVTPNATQPVYKGSSGNLVGELFMIRYDVANRAVVYSSYLGTNTNDYYNYGNGDYSSQLIGEKYYTNPSANFNLNQAITVDFPVSPDAFQSTMIGNVQTGDRQYFAKINTTTGKLEYGSYIGSLPTGLGENAHTLLVLGDDVCLGGETPANDYPITPGAIRTTHLGNNDIFITKLSLCYPDVINDSLFPMNQVVCLHSPVDSILGAIPQLGNTSTIIRNGIAQPSQANQTNFTYQWQESNDSISWIFISGASEKDYLPLPITAKKYFRRIAKPAFCDYADTSSVATISLSGIIAVKPDVGSAGSFFSCPGSNITLGTAAVPGFIYSWSPASNLSSINTAQTLFNSPLAGAYTVILSATGPNGCTARDTATVFNYAAYAGPDKILCQGSQVQLGGQPLAGLTGVTYSWSPVAGLSCSNCSQPVVTNTGLYNLTVNVLLPTGGNCITTDAILVGESTLPNNPGGPDITTCNGIPLVLGTPRVAGYIYNWTPGVFLSAIADTAQPIYNQFNASISPLYNPILFTLTASNPAGCTVTDTVKVYVIDVSAGEDGCRPLQLGKGDNSGGLATYQWVEVLAGNIEAVIGPGELSSTTIPNPIALANPAITGDKIYRVKETWNGVTCSSDVVVRINCPCPEIKLRFKSNSGCPTVNGLDSVLIYVKDPNPNYTYSWSPATGLNTTIGPIVKTGITTSIIYTCTATNIYDPSLHCSKQIKINFFNTTAPVFDAPDKTICKNASGSIGLAPVTGLEYAWTSSLSDNVFDISSNPTVTGLIDISYFAEVTDPVTGCYADDTVKVHVPDIPIEAGPTRPSCTNGGFTIGTPAVSGFVYHWVPSTGLDNPNIAQPMIITNDADIAYILVVTDPASGCTATDVVFIQHSDNPSLDPIAAPAAYCEGSNTYVQIGDPALNGVVYHWLPVTNLNDPNIAQPIANPSVTTTYTVTGTFTGACISNASQTVTVTVIPKPTAITSVTNNCINSQLNITTNAINPVFAWNPSTGLNNIYLQNPISTSSAPITYTVYVTDLITNCTNSSTATVLPPVIANAGIDKEICTGNTVQIGSIAVSGVTYSWLPATGLANYNTSNPSTLAGLPAGIYTYTVSATSGGCTKTDDVIVKVNTLPTINLTPGVTICKDASVQIGIPAQAGYSYSWSPSTGLSNPLQSNPIATPSTTITYTLTVSNIANGCTNHASTTVTVNTTGAPVVSAEAANHICPGDAVQLNATVTGTGSYTYVWSPQVHFQTSPFISNPIVTPPVSITYQVLVTNTANGCSNTAGATVTVLDTCNIVPVNWLAFTAVLRNGKTLLDWTVAMEQNNAEFVVERSLDNIHWTALFSTASLGNSNTARNYHGIDPMPFNGINFYRIRQVDLDGHATYSVTRSVKPETDGPFFIVYPNPAHDILNYQLLHTGAVTDCILRLYSVDGRLLKKFHLKLTSGTIPIYDLPAGTYIITISDYKGRTGNKRIVVQK